MAMRDFLEGGGSGSGGGWGEENDLAPRARRVTEGDGMRADMAAKRLSARRQGEKGGKQFSYWLGGGGVGGGGATG